MKLPNGYSSYYQGVIEKAKKFISYGFWTGLTEVRLSKWINNFEDDFDKYIPIKILDNLLYRSDDHFRVLLKEMLFSSLPIHLYKKYNIIDNGKDLSRKLTANDNEYKIRFVLSRGANDHISKSCFSVARLLDKHLRINKSIILTPKEVLNNFNKEHIYIICDDFSGTGNQLIKNIKEQGEEYSSLINLSNNIIFHPMIIHEESIQNINSAFPNLQLCYIEKLSKNNNFFSEENNIFNDGINTIRRLKEHYLDMLDKYEIIGVDKLGYSNQGLILAFEDAAPDNSLPLLWYSGRKFTPLFNRT